MLFLISKFKFLINLIIVLLICNVIFGQSVNLPVSQAQQSPNTSISNQTQPANFQNANSINNYYNYTNNANINSDYKRDIAKRLNDKDYFGAKADYVKLLSTNPRNPEAHFNYALLMIEHFNDLNTANLHFQAAIELKPNSAKFHFIYATILKIFYNNPTAATKQYIIATKLKPSLISPNSDKFFRVTR